MTKEDLRKILLAEGEVISTRIKVLAKEKCDEKTANRIVNICSLCYNLWVDNTLDYFELEDNIKEEKL